MTKKTPIATLTRGGKTIPSGSVIRVPAKGTTVSSSSETLLKYPPGKQPPRRLVGSALEDAMLRAAGYDPAKGVDCKCGEFVLPDATFGLKDGEKVHSQPLCGDMKEIAERLADFDAVASYARMARSALAELYALFLRPPSPLGRREPRTSLPPGLADRVRALLPSATAKQKRTP